MDVPAAQKVVPAAQVVPVVPAGNVANAPGLLKAAPTVLHRHRDPMDLRRPDLMDLPLAVPTDRRHRLAPMGLHPPTDVVAPVDPVASVAPVAPVDLAAGVVPVSTKNACSLTPWNSTPTKMAA